MSSRSRSDGVAEGGQAVGSWSVDLGAASSKELDDLLLPRPRGGVQRRASRRHPVRSDPPGGAEAADELRCCALLQSPAAAASCIFAWALSVPAVYVRRAQ